MSWMSWFENTKIYHNRLIGLSKLPRPIPKADSHLCKPRVSTILTLIFLPIGPRALWYKDPFFPE